MSEKDPIRLFVMHAFQEHEEYARIFEYLESRDNFFYVNTSRPENKPEGGATTAVQEAIREQIKPCEVVVFPAGVYSQDPNLINFELKVAQAFEKPVLAIMAFGGTQVIPKEAMDAATDTVEWNDRAIADAVKRLARGGGGAGDAMWDTVEFNIDDLDIPDLKK